ncbi:MAG: DUF4160 domain-containing protein [Chloroflexi bacterium]|nr:DUF4160 domain-containing protein [Chloroflexota bacterium]
MYSEPSVPHQSPHFHAHYQNQDAVYSLDPIEMISGGIPRRQQRLVEAWAELRQPELLEDWARLKAGQPPQPIAPLS